MSDMIWISPWWLAAVKVTPTFPHVDTAIEQRWASNFEWDYIDPRDNENSSLLLLWFNFTQKQNSQPNNYKTVNKYSKISQKFVIYVFHCYCSSVHNKDTNANEVLQEL